MTTILVICKRSMFIQAIQPHLSGHGIELLLVSNNPKEALNHYQSLRPDIVLMDANWSDPYYMLSGPDIIEALVAFDATVRVIVTTTIHEPDLLVKIKSEAVKGYFPKTCKDVLEKIIACIKTVHQGGMYYYEGN